MSSWPIQPCSVVSGRPRWSVTPSTSTVFARLAPLRLLLPLLLLLLLAIATPTAGRDDPAGPPASGPDRSGTLLDPSSVPPRRPSGERRSHVGRRIAPPGRPRRRGCQPLPG